MKRQPENPEPVMSTKLANMKLMNMKYRKMKQVTVA
jgi:hypothetical protein